MIRLGQRVTLPSGEVGQLLHKCIKSKDGEAWIVLVNKRGVRVKVEDIRQADNGTEESKHADK